MASIIRIKRSTTAGDPTTLGNGELAYSAADSSVVSGGDRLYVGIGNEIAGNAATHIVVGGKFFTDMLDHAKGTLTASSAIITDSNSKIDNLKVDNLDLNGNTLSVTNTNGNLTLAANGTGFIDISTGVVKIASTTPATASNTGALQVAGGVSIEGALYINGALAAGSGSFTSINNTPIGNTTASTGAFTQLDTDNIRIDGNAITSTNTNGDITLTPNGTGKLVLNNVYINGTSDTLAEFIYDTVGGAVTAGNGIDVTPSDVGNTTTVSLNTEYVQDLVGDMVSSNTESGISVTYDDTNGKLDFNVNDPTITIDGDADGSGTMTNLGNTTITVTLDTVNSNVGQFGSSTAIPIVTVNGKGLVTAVSTASITTSLGIAADAGQGSDTIALATDTLTFAGGEGIDTSINASTNTVTISGEDASTSNKGVASFETNDFNVTAGAVELKDTVIKGLTVDASAAVTPSGHAIAIVGGEGVDVTASGATITVAGEDASDTNKGIASFASSGFNVTAGVVTLSDTVVKAVTTDSGAMSMAGNAISILGGEGIDVTHAGTSITVTGEYASGANAGIASFSATHFNVSNVGDVTIKDGGVANAKLVNSAVTIGSTSVSLGATQTSLAGLTAVTVDNINIDGNTISSTNVNGNIILDPNGTGVIDASATRITNLAEPSADSDAATKYYVDAARSGLDVKNSVKAATTANITLSNTQTIDGVALSVGDRVLVKDQTTASQNGIYVVASSSWTRSTDADAPAELNPGTFVFVEQGTINDNTGFVVVSDSVVTIGTDDINWTLFSASGTLIAGNGLSKNGYTLEVNVAGSGGIELSSDALQLKSTIAGTGLDYASGVLSLETTLAGLGLTYTAGVIDLNVATNGGLELDGSDNLQLKSTVAGAGLTLTSGVLDVIGTADRITANANSIDIASTYVGQSTITTLGTITAGTWQGSVIAALYGGTGHSSYSTGDLLVASGASTLSKLTVGTSGKILQSNGTTLVYGDIDGGTYA
jgi:hypothetical protein